MKLFQPLLALIASATDSVLAKQLSYAQAELKILRARLPKRIVTTPEERAILLKHGRSLGSAIDAIITLVSPLTFHRWVREEKRAKGRAPSKTGRPRKSIDLRELICRIARETGFGYGRILGELRKLGINSVSYQTVRNILKEHGIPTGPQRGQASWSEFLARHAQTLYACDFFSKSVVTPKGLIDMYLLVVIHWNTREIWVSPATAQPDSAWVAQQARNFLLHTADRGPQPTHLIHDRDTKFTAQFDGIWKSHGAEVIKLPARQPILNSRCERVIQTLQVELLRQFIAFGERHLNYLVREFVAYYNQRRAHSRRNHLPPGAAARPAPNESAEADEIVCRERLGGVIRWYERVA